MVTTLMFLTPDRLEVRKYIKFVTAPTVHTAECGHGDEDWDKEGESTVQPLSKCLNKTSSYINQCFISSPSDVSADFGIDSHVHLEF